MRSMPQIRRLLLKISQEYAGDDWALSDATNGTPPQTRRILDAMSGFSSSNSALPPLIYVTIKQM